MQSDRLHRVLEHVTEVHSLCDVLGEDFIAIVNEVHPGLHETSDPGKPTSISDSTLGTLAQVVATLAAEKTKRAAMVRRACFFLYTTYARMHARHNLWLIPSTCSALHCSCERPWCPWWSCGS